MHFALTMPLNKQKIPCRQVSFKLRTRTQDKEIPNLRNTNLRKTSRLANVETVPTFSCTWSVEGWLLRFWCGWWRHRFAATKVEPLQRHDKVIPRRLFFRLPNAIAGFNISSLCHLFWLRPLYSRTPLILYMNYSCMCKQSPKYCGHADWYDLPPSDATQSDPWYSKTQATRSIYLKRCPTSQM